MKPYKYIFVAGAPGSKWSSVVKNIYYSPDIDQSDYSDARTYYHDASGQMELMHLGVYWDPGMEFDLPKIMTDYSREQAESIFDRPFSGQGIRIIKSHIFCHNIDYLRSHWPDAPIVLVHRPNDACLGWWVRCGHFGITYPSYHAHYRDLREMAHHINEQNHDLVQAWDTYEGFPVTNNRELCDLLGISGPPEEYKQDYQKSDVRVKLI